MYFNYGIIVLPWILLVNLKLCVSGFTEVNLISAHGYPLEIHPVTTEDGYILELHRIPHGRNENHHKMKNDSYGNLGRKHKRVVFFTHCIFCSSTAFFALGPNNGLAYMAANVGFDVWLLNVRGTKFSRKHIKLSPSSEEFWKFGWHEHGIFDVPASIDYILRLTGESQVDYIGFSMGNLMFMALISEKPEYNEKIRSMTGLAPVVYLDHSPGIVLNLSPLIGIFAKLFANLRYLNVPPPELRINEFGSLICNSVNYFIYGALCDFTLSMIGAKSNNLDEKMLPFFFSLFPEETGLRSFIHLGQIYNSGRFEKYDFGPKMNQIRYGSPVPPLYNLSKVVSPISLFWGSEDQWVNGADVTRLISELPNVVFTETIPSYSHFDMIWSKTAHIDVYEDVIGRLKVA